MALRWKQDGTSRGHLHVMGLQDNAASEKCGQEKESYYHILALCQYPALARCRMNIHGYACVESIDISRASIRQAQAQALRIGPF
jgi:hypothetical protein